MIIRQTDLRRIASGDVTLAFRRWRRPTVRSGGTLRTTIGVLAIDDVQEVQENEITDEMARSAGYGSRDALLAALAKAPAGTTYCIRLRLSGPDPRVSLREHADVSPAELEEIGDRLGVLDRRSKSGPWTRATLEAIRLHPGRLAADLAASLGWEKAWFKPQVRKLKELGLTESLEVGYRLSPRGAAVLEGLARQQMEARPTLTAHSPVLPHSVNTMGDKSPKSTKKKAGQKEVKATEVKREKKAASDAKRVVTAKK